MALIGNLTVTLTAVTSGFQQALGAAQQTLGTTQRAVVGFQGTIRGLGTELGRFAAGFVSVAAATRAVEGLVRAGARMETLRVAFTELTGSTRDGSAAMDLARRKADELGFGLFELTQGYKDLVAASRGSILAGADVARIFESLTNAGRTLQLGTGELETVFEGFTRAMNAGRLTLEQIGGGEGLGRAFPAIVQTTARALGVTTDELRRMAAAGDLISDLVLPRLVRQFDIELGQRAVGSANTLTAALERMQNAFKELGDALAQSGILDYLTKAANATGQILRVMTERRQPRDVSPGLQAEIGTLGQQFPGADVTVTPAYQELRRLEARRQDTEREIQQAQARLRAAEATIARVNERLADPTLGLVGRVQANLQGIGAVSTTSEAGQRIRDLQSRLERINEVYQETLALFRRQVAELPQVAQGPVQVPPALDPNRYEDAIRLSKVLIKQFEEFDALAKQAQQRITLEPEAAAEVLRQLAADQQRKLLQIEGILAAPYNQPLLPLLGARFGGQQAPVAPTATLPAGAFPKARPEDIQRALPLIQQQAPLYGLDPTLVAALAYVESYFNPKAVGPQLSRGRGRAQGAFQFIPGTAQQYGLANPFDFQQSLTAGLSYLRDLSAQFGGDIPSILSGYHAGAGAVPRGGGVPRIASTQQYVKDVTALQQALQGQLATGGPIAATTIGPEGGVASFRERLEELRATLNETIRARNELANADVFAKILTQLQSDFDQLALFPEEFQATEFERLNQAAATGQRVRELFAKDAQAARLLLGEEIQAWQEVLGAAVARTSLRDLREEQRRQVDEIIRGLDQERQSLSLTSEQLLRYQLASRNASEADTERAVGLLAQNKQLMAATEVARFITTDLVALVKDSARGTGDTSVLAQQRQLLTVQRDINAAEANLIRLRAASPEQGQRIQEQTRLLIGYQKEFAAVQKNIRETTQQTETFFERLATRLGDLVLKILANTLEVDKALANLFQKGLKSAVDLVSEIFTGAGGGVGAGVSAASAANSGLGEGLGDFAGTIPTRQGGGPVMPRRFYTVGEQGAETLYTGNTSGYIFPHGMDPRQQAPMVFNQNIYGVTDASGFQRNRGEYEYRALQFLRNAQRNG